MTAKKKHPTRWLAYLGIPLLAALFGWGATVAVNALWCTDCECDDAAEKGGEVAFEHSEMGADEALEAPPGAVDDEAAPGTADDEDPPGADDEDSVSAPAETPPPPGDAKRGALLRDARRAAIAGRVDEAIELGQEALELGGGANAHRILAIAYEKKGDGENAVTHYNAWLATNCSNKLAPVVRQKIITLGGTPSC